jgi:hypothetical protein
MTAGQDDDNLCHAGPDPAKFLRDRNVSVNQELLALRPDGMTASLGRSAHSLDPRVDPNREQHSVKVGCRARGEGTAPVTGL